VSDERSWSLRFHPAVEGQLEKLDRSVAQRIREKLQWLTENASEIQHDSLRHELGGLYKLRVGDWRVIYRLSRQERMVLVVDLGHRSEVYG